MMLLFTLFFACQEDTESGFSTSGNNSVDTDSITGSTGDGSGSESGGGSANSVNPVVSGLDGMFIDTDNGIAIEMHIYVTDPQDDLLNGMLEVDYQWGDAAESVEVDIDGEMVLVEDGELTFLIPEADGTSTYEVSVTVYDEASNPSDIASTQVVPAEYNE